MQKALIKEYENKNNEKLLIQISLLNTLVPICDTFSAIKILNSFPCKEFETKIIGTYLCAECLEMDYNSYLNDLLEQYDYYNDFEKSIIKYLEALHIQNRELKSKKEVLNIIEESVLLSNKYVSNYYFKYLLTHNNLDLIKAKENIEMVLTKSYIDTMSINEFITPKKFIEEKILMNVLTQESYGSIFEI